MTIHQNINLHLFSSQLLNTKHGDKRHQVCQAPRGPQHTIVKQVTQEGLLLYVSDV